MFKQSQLKDRCTLRPDRPVRNSTQLESRPFLKKKKVTGLIIIFICIVCSNKDHYGFNEDTEAGQVGGGALEDVGQ